MNLANIRTDYRRGRLRREDLREDPIEQFQMWLNDACSAGLTEPTAMSLATSSKEGRCLVRTVLLKGLDERGLVFFTNLESRKARHIQENPNVSLLFPWLLLERQVIITGQAARISTVESLKYFLSRPRGSQLAAWASPQSNVISSRQVLEMEWERLKEKFGAGEIPLPSFWGGYRVTPNTIEFWQGGHHRLHDRFQYARQTDGTWTIDRLAP
ncbi:MAG: pyridoxamine 5'-phosphate oxidase [Verrucomicrobia bacterium]|nr:pyridoxamine 5'-phosphate oxidase [Verrucomicrobiota bacterium]